MKMVSSSLGRSRLLPPSTLFRLPLVVLRNLGQESWPAFCQMDAFQGHVDELIFVALGRKPAGI